MTSSLSRFGVRFSDVSFELLTVLLAGVQAVPENLPCKDLPASP